MSAYLDVYEPSTYGYDDWRQDMLADAAMRLHDEHEREVAAAGGCADPDCYHNLDLSDRDELPF